MFKRRILARRSVNSGFEDIHHSCTVRFLDDSDPLTVTFQNDTKGQYLIDHVCSSLDLVEKDYFGLRYVDKEKQRYWVDPLKVAHKQLKDVNPPILSFRVKYYPSDPGRVKEDITRYYLFLQLVRDLNHGRLLCSLEQAIQMSAYILQAEFGDHEVEFPSDYITQAKMIPKQVHGHEEEVVRRHKALRGQLPGEIEVLFLEAASKLDTYGIDPHPIKDVFGKSMYVGMTHQGVATFQGDAKVNLFKWNQIDKLDFEGKHFIIIMTAAEKKQKHDFKCSTAVACKSLWKYAVQQRYFFTLNSSNTAPVVKAGRGLFRRGSSFRFRGQCESEVFANSANINRDAPIFTRWASNPQFFRASGSIGTGSLPTEFRSISLTEDNIAAFENSQSDISVLESICNSKRPESSQGEKSSPVRSPTVQESAPLLALDPGSGFLNQLSTPLPPVEEGNGTPESLGPAESPKLVAEEPEIPVSVESPASPEIPVSLESAPLPQPEMPPPDEAESPIAGLETAPVQCESFPEASSPAASPPVKATGTLQHSRSRAYIVVCVLVFALLLVAMETELLAPLLSLVNLESVWRHLRHNYYLPIRGVIFFW